MTSTAIAAGSFEPSIHIAIRSTPSPIWEEAREVRQHRELFYFLAWPREGAVQADGAWRWMGNSPTAQLDRRACEPA